eukprot:scaffold296_cov164-Ochromonas_danica.AAC.15
MNEQFFNNCSSQDPSHHENCWSCNKSSTQLLSVYTTTTLSSDISTHGQQCQQALDLRTISIIFQIWKSGGFVGKLNSSRLCVGNGNADGLVVVCLRQPPIIT